MSNHNRLAHSGLLLLTMTAALTACTGGGDVTITNESSSDVSITTGDDTFIVPSRGATVVLGVGCIPDEVRADFESGAFVGIAGPICSDQELFIPNSETETLNVRPVS
ncbi:hypothetical protein [Rhodoglobus sp.]